MEALLVIGTISISALFVWLSHKWEYRKGWEKRLDEKTYRYFKGL